MSTQTNTVLITGASSGIGLDIARGFLEKGSNVVMNARNGEKLAAAEQAAEAYRHDRLLGVLPRAVLKSDRLFGL